ADDGRAKQTCQRDRQFLPDTNEPLEARVVRASVGNLSPAAIVLPLRRLGPGAPLLLEMEGAAFRRPTAGGGHGLPPFHGPLQDVAVEASVGVGAVDLLREAATRHPLAPVPTQPHPRRDRPLAGPDHAQLGIAGELM